ncbi:MAG: winged helix-turn-helix transcriptional regulator [bacterium]|nr:winged helix-turn-helix transcriptional regulator [bacterium]
MGSPDKTDDFKEDVDGENEGAEMISGMRCAADKAAELLRCIGSPYRLLILCLLMEKEQTVSEICEAIGARQSLTSQHLTRLRLDGLVEAERRGHFVIYSLTDTVTKEIISTLHKHFCADSTENSTC